MTPSRPDSPSHPGHRPRKRFGQHFLAPAWAAKVVDAIKRLPERRRFMKGIFAWVGFRSTSIEYVRDARVAGESRFSAWKLWNLALEGLTSFSTAPLRVWTYLGLAVASLAFVYAAFIIMRTVVHGIDVPG